MIYQIYNDYYVRVGNKYVKLSMSLDKNGEVVMKPTNEKVEKTDKIKVKAIDFKNEKDNIAKSLRGKSYSNIERN